MPVATKPRPFVTMIHMYKPIDDKLKYCMKLQRSIGEKSFYYLKTHDNTYGEMIRISQRLNLWKSIKDAKNGEPRGLLRKLSCDVFQALKKEEVENSITSEINKTRDLSVKGILEQALEWTKGNYTNPWWI